MTEHEEPYVRMVHEFLGGTEWNQNVALFCNGHCRAFVCLQFEDGDETKEEKKYDFFSHGQYEMFQTFQFWGNEMLHGILEDLGIDEKAFVLMCETKLLEGTSGEVQERIYQLLDIVDALGSFENFCRLMEQSFERITREERERQERVQSQLDMKEWDLQLALAISLIDGSQSKNLCEKEAVLVPWAQAVMALHRGLEKVGAPGYEASDPEEEEAELERLTTVLMRERLHVEYIVAERLREDTVRMERDMMLQYKGDEGKSSEDDTVLSKLIADSGTTQLAISQHRSLLRDDDENPSISDKEYEEIYLQVREAMKRGGGKNTRGALGKLKRDLKFEYPVLESEPMLLEDIADLVWLEDRLRKIHRDIQQELHDPGSVAYVAPGKLPSQQSMTSISASSRGLTIETNEQALASIHDYISTPGSASPKSPVRTPKDARLVIQQMHNNLKNISQEREVERLRVKLRFEAKQAQNSPKTKGRVRQLNKMATEMVEMQAISHAEKGEAVNVSLRARKRESGEDSGTDSDADLTEDDDDDDEDEEEDEEPKSTVRTSGSVSPSRGTGLNVRTNEDESAGSLLRETERLRRQLYLRATPKPMTQQQRKFSSSRNIVQLNSPKQAGPKNTTGMSARGSVSSHRGSTASFRGSSGTPKRDLTVNPSTLRFLTNEING